MNKTTAKGMNEYMSERFTDGSHLELGSVFRHSALLGSGWSIGLQTDPNHLTHCY